MPPPPMIQPNTEFINISLYYKFSVNSHSIIWNFIHSILLEKKKGKTTKLSGLPRFDENTERIFRLVVVSRWPLWRPFSQPQRFTIVVVVYRKAPIRPRTRETPGTENLVRNV